MHAPGSSAPAGMPRAVDVALVAGGRLIEDVSSRDDLVMGGVLIVETNRDADTLWKGLSRRSARWIHERELRVYTIDAARIAAETASQPSFVDQLAVWALLGAYASLRLDDDTIAALADGLRSRLARLFGEGHYLIDDISGAVRRGATRLKQLDVSLRDTEGLAAASDGEAPWTVKDASGWDNTVFDATRFWHSVGYLYDSGQSDRALADPYLATGVIPARSSAFRDMSPYRLRIPEWLPENCTGCGLCWAQCPDSALPPSIDSVAAVVETSMTLTERAGIGLVQMKRFSGHLVKQAYRLVAGDGMNQYVRVGVLLDDAFAQLVDKLDLDDEKRKLLEEEFGHVRSHAEHLAFAKTDTFFNAPNETEKGSGSLLSIALNPLACTGCGVCIDVCPEGALEWADQTPDRLARSRDNWTFQAELPQTDVEDIEHFVTADSATHVNRLLDRTAYHSLVGGDGSYPGNSAKTAVHLAAGAIETVMKSRFDAHVTRLSDLIDRLQGKIQGDVADVLKINDFDEFSRRLDQFDKSALTPDSLASAVGGDVGSTLDPDHLRRLTHMLDALREQRRLYIEGADGSGRARMTMTIDSDAVRLWSGMYPYNPLPYPWVCHVPGDGIQVAGGVQDGLALRVAGEIAVCRAAERELDGDYDENAAATAFGPDDLTDAERRLIPPTIVLGEVGTTSWDDIATLLAGRSQVRLILINTAGTDVDAGDAGVSIEANLVSMARGNPAAYAAQLSVGYPGHLIQRVSEGMDHDGPAVFHVLAPDPIRNGIAPEKTAAQARLAVECRTFPLFAVSNGALSVEGNPDAGRAWLTRDMKFHEPSGKESTVETAMTVADWAIGEARFETHFRIVAKGELSEHMLTLDEYIALDDEAREGKEPYIHFADKNQRHFLAIVSPAMVRATDACHDLWRWLRHEAEPIVVESPLPVVAAETADMVEAPAPGVADASVHEALTERLLKLSGFSADPEFFKQSLREFVVARNLEAGASDDDTPLPQ